MCSCFCGLPSILAEDIKPRASCAEEVLGYAHISKGLSSVSVLLRASNFTECCRGTAAELKGSYAVSSHQIIQYVSSWFWVITPCFIRSFSNQVKFYDSSNMFHTFPCYTLFLSPLALMLATLALGPVGAPGSSQSVASVPHHGP